MSWLKKKLRLIDENGRRYETDAPGTTITANMLPSQIEKWAKETFGDNGQYAVDGFLKAIEILDEEDKKDKRGMWHYYSGLALLKAHADIK